MIAVVDVGTGNVRSVVRALRAVLPPMQNESVQLSTDPEIVRRADRVVVPGQGAFGDCSTALNRSGGALAAAISDSIRAGKPFLGICLGLQVLFEGSEEAPGCSGLGIFRGRVKKLPLGTDEYGTPLKIPHMGWNRVTAGPAGSCSLAQDEWFYFVHSYVVAPEDSSVVAGRTDHGVSFVSAVARDNVLAVQFHPEKSQAAGLAFLTRWLGDKS